MCRNKIFAQIFLKTIMKKSEIKINAQNSQNRVKSSSLTCLENSKNKIGVDVKITLLLFFYF